MSSMKATVLHEYGPPSNLKYEDFPVPVLLEGDALVRVFAAGINPVDAKVRSGVYRDYMPFTLPLILGWDVAGVIDEISGHANGFSVGDAVFSRPDSKRPGSYAQYTAIRTAELAKKPSSLNFVEAAGVPLAGGTAWQALFDHGGLESGQTVLIHAGSGGVGGLAVQLAKWRGAVVFATASTHNVEYVKSLGADRVIDYKTERFEDVAKDVDLVIDTIGGETYQRSWAVLRPEGIMVSLVTPSAADDAVRHGRRGVQFMMQPNSVQLAEIGKLIDSGFVKVSVQEILPLSEAAHAHELVESGHTRGKIVLKVV